MVDVLLVPTGVPCWSVPLTSAREWNELIDACNSSGVHSARLRPANYHVLSTHKPPILSVYESFCVCRYNRVGQGDGFIAMWYSACWSALWAICLINSSSLFTQRDSQPTAFPLPLATLSMLACTFVYLCASAVHLKMYFTNAWYYTCGSRFSVIVHQRNLAQHHSPVERRLKTAIYRITLLRKQSEESIKL